MKKLLLLAAAYLAFKGGRGAARPVAPGGRGVARPGLGELLPILLAPRWLRLPMLARAFLAGRKAPPRTGKP